MNVMQMRKEHLKMKNTGNNYIKSLKSSQWFLCAGIRTGNCQPGEENIGKPVQRVFDDIGQRLFFCVKKDPGRNDRSLLFRNLYLVTQMDYSTSTATLLDHLLNTFFPSSDVLLNA